MLPFWLEQTATRRPIYMMFLESGGVADEPSDAAFALQANEAGLQSMGYIRLVLPLVLANEPEGAFASLANGFAGSLDFAFGQAGYAVNWNDLGHYGVDAMNGMRRIAGRHPGVDLSHPAVTQYAVAKGGIKSINWLTFITPDHVSRLGGIDRLRADLGADITVRNLSRGVSIQAGARPGIGDVNRRDDLPLYQRVGRVLAPLRGREHPAFLGRDGLPSAETTQKWLGRFDN